MLNIQTDKDILQNNNELNNPNSNSISEVATIEEVEDSNTIEEIVDTASSTVSLNDTSTFSENNSDTPEPNCLALTVRKDYNLTIIKNIFTTSGRMSLKIALSTLFLNFLRMFF